MNFNFHEFFTWENAAVVAFFLVIIVGLCGLCNRAIDRYLPEDNLDKYKK